MSAGFVYDFKSGWKVIAGARRPDHCDKCKVPCTDARPAYNTQAIRCFLCPECMGKWNAYRRKYLYIDQSKIDACNFTGLAAHHMHEDDYVPKGPLVKEKVPAHRQIARLKYELELKRLQEEICP